MATMIPFDLSTIQDLETWSTVSAEIRSEFERVMYGPPKEWGDWSRGVRRIGIERDAGTIEEIDIHVEGHTWRLLFALPEGVGPYTCLVGLNFNGNATLLDSPEIALGDHWVYPWVQGVVDSRLTDASRGSSRERVALDYLMARGFAVATVCAQEIAPDTPEPSRPNESCIGTWASGLSLILDVLASEPYVNLDATGVFGHSRLGKTALLAAARDPRFKFCIPVQSGCGGLAPSRTTVGETVEAITKQFPHWFLPEFASYAGREDELPFDQHHLAALVAPSPIYAPNAEDDQWANPDGQREMLERIRPIEKLVRGRDDLSRYSIRPGAHALDMRDWPAIADWVEFVTSAG